MFTHELSNGVRISPALMGIGAAGAVACLTALENGEPNWPLAGFWGFVFLLLPHLLEVVWAGIVTVRRPVDAPLRPAVAEQGVEALDEPPDAPYDPPVPIPGAVQGRPKPLDRTAEMAVLRGRVLAFLQDCIRVNGEHSQFIPRHSRLGYSSPEWGEMVRALGGAAHAEPNKYTTVMGYESLRALRVAVQEGLPLYPTPKAGGAESPAERPRNGER